MRTSLDVENITFLDVENNTLTTSVHIKPSNQPQAVLELFKFLFLPHQKAIPCSLALRGQRLNCTTSSTETYNQRLQEVVVNRGYPPNLVAKQIRCAVTHTQRTYTPNTNPNPPVLIIQFRPKLTKAKQVLHSHVHIPQSDPESRD